MAQSARDRLLAKSGKKAEPTTASKKDDRPVVQLEGNTADAVERYTAFDNARKTMEGQEKASRSLLMPVSQQKTIQFWIEQGRRSENIKFTTPAGSSYICQVKDTLSSANRGFRVPKGKDGESIDVETHLLNHGVPVALTKRLIEEKEFVEKNVMSIQIAKLEESKPELAEKLMNHLS